MKIFKNLQMEVHSGLEGQLESLRRHGFAYLPGVINSEEIEAIKECMKTLEPIKESNDFWGDPGDRIGMGVRSLHVKNAFNRNFVFWRLMDKPGVIELAEAALGDDCHLVGMSAWRSGPGRPDQSLHSDWVPVPLPSNIASNPEVELPIFIATAHFYLEDITEDLGPTKFIPGSHRAGRPPEDGEIDWNGVEQENVIVNAGDVVMFRSEIWHRGSANSSDISRHLVQVHYGSRWMAPRMPPYLNQLQFDKDLVAQATQRQLRLLGDHPIAGLYT